MASFERVMGDENMVIVPVDKDAFGTELIPITLKCNDLERFVAGMEISAACIYVYMK